MTRKLFVLLLLSVSVFVNGEIVVIKSPGYFTEPIRNGHGVFPDSLMYMSDA